MDAEGWYKDPFGLHEDRWMSDGHPTKLVRDGGAESYDAPPSEEFTGELEPDDGPEHVDGEDLVRADGQSPPRRSFRRALCDVFDQTSHTS